MTQNQNAARQVGGAQEIGAVGLANDTLILPANRDFFNPLLAQAESRMSSDPANYGSHFLIWLALFSAKYRIGEAQ